MTRDRRLPSELFLSAAQAFKQVNWQPAVDVYQTPHGWVLKYELAGVSPDEIKLTISGRKIWLRGTRRDMRIGDRQQSYCMEISYNQFERALELPCNLDDMAVDTDYRNGMLVVRLTCKSET